MRLSRTPSVILRRMQSGSSIRLHRRAVYLDGGMWTILTPRPGDPQRYSTGVTDDSVQVLGSVAGMEFLAHALWALAFQHKERTALLFDLPVMVPNAATGESSRPIVWVNADLGSPSPEMLDALRGLLPLASESDGTLKLRTAGLDRALTLPESFAAKELAEPDVPKWSAGDWDTWVTRQAGLVTATIPPAALRAYAVAAGEFGSFSWESLDDAGDPISADEIVVFDRTMLDRAAAIRAGRSSMFPDRAIDDLTGAERSKLWKRYATN